MAYIKQNFKDGDTLTANQLNYIEDAIYTLSTGENIKYTNIWYTDVSSLDLNTECNNNSNGWAYLLESDCNLLRNVPINLAKFVTTSTSGKIKLGICTKNSTVISKIVTGEFSKDNNNKETVIVRLSETITLSSDEYLVIEPYITNDDDFVSKDEAYTFYFGTMDGHNGFYSRIPVDLGGNGASPWRSNTTSCIGWSFGYTDAPSGIGSDDNDNDDNVANIKIDDKMSSTSDNAVSNKVIKKYVDAETSFRGIEYFNYDFLHGDTSSFTKLTGGYNKEHITTNGYMLQPHNAKLILNHNIDIDYIKIVSKVKLTDTSASIVLGSKSYNNTQHASAVTFDFNNKKMIFAKKGTQDSISGAYKTIDISDIVNTNDLEYYLEIGRKRRELYGAITNYRTGKRYEYTIVESGSNLIYPCGWLYDIPTVSQISGSQAYLQNIKCYVPTDVKIVFLGDSITEGFGTKSDECWATLCCDYFGNSINMGRSGARLPQHTQIQINELLPFVKPKYVVVTIGTNGENTPERLNTMVDSIKKLNAIPIVNHIYRKTSSVVSVNNDIAALNLPSARFDYATSIDNDLNKGQNTSLFLSSDLLHLNIEGNKKVFERFIADCGYINFVK